MKTKRNVQLVRLLGIALAAAIVFAMTACPVDDPEEEPPPTSTTFTVTYNGNGNTSGAVPVDGSSPYAEGATVTVKDNTGNLVKTGNRFSGWNTAANGSGTSYAAGNTFAINADTTLYAKWTVKPEGEGSYVITGNGTAFTAKAGETIIGNAGQSIQTVIDAIKADAAGGDCDIQFGDGDTPLDLGTAAFAFDGGSGKTDWGVITLTGKLTAATNSNISVINLRNGVKVESTADVENTAAGGGFYNNTGTLTINGGIIKVTSGEGIYISDVGSTVNIKDGTVQASTGSAVYNFGGILNISGGTIQATGIGGVAIEIRGGTTETNKTAISEAPGKTTLITSVNANSNRGTVYIWANASFEMTGGTVSNTYTSASSSGEYKAIYIMDNASYNPTVSITGGTLSTAANSKKWAVQNAKASNTANIVVDADCLAAGSLCENVTLLNAQWTKIEGFGSTDYIKEVFYANGRFFAVIGIGSSTMETSTDGITWTSVNVSAFGGSTINKIAFDGYGTFVAGGSNGKMATSTNGTTWTAVTDSTLGSSSADGVNSLIYANNIFIAGSTSGKMAISADGTTWTAVTDSTFDGSPIYGIAYGNGKFVAGGDYLTGKMATSTDGLNWTAGTNNILTDGVGAITFANGKFIACGSDKMASSTDGENWEAINTGDIFTGNAGVNAITYANNKYIAVGYVADASFSNITGKIASSTDGITWTAMDTGDIFDGSMVSTIAYGNNRFIASGNQGRIAYLLN